LAPHRRTGDFPPPSLHSRHFCNFEQAVTASQRPRSKCDR